MSIIQYLNISVTQSIGFFNLGDSVRLTVVSEKPRRTILETVAMNIHGQMANENIFFRDKMVCCEIGGEYLVARLCFEYLKTPCNAASGSLKHMITMGENTKNKGGRPTLPDYKKKSHSVKVMFSPVDMIYLRSCASECGLNLAAYVYRAAMNQETTVLLTPEEHAAVNELRNIGNNLNQITKAMHLGMQVEQDIRDIISFITGIIRKVR